MDARCPDCGAQWDVAGPTMRVCTSGCSFERDGPESEWRSISAPKQTWVPPTPEHGDTLRKLDDAASKMSNKGEDAHPRRDGHLRDEWTTSETGATLIIRISDVTPERVTWLWPGRVPLGKLTIIDGDPGVGKSTLCLDLAARVSAGHPMPDGASGDLGGPTGVVVMSAEDGLADTIRPRLDAAGADTGRIVALTAVRDGEGERLPTLADLAAMESAILRVGARLVIVDPLMAYLPDEVRAYSDHHVRRALAPLAALAERTGAAVLVIRHLRKSSAASPMYRGGGSIGIIAGARSALLAAVDPDDPSGVRRVLAPLKSNLAAMPPALAYHLEPAGSTVRVVWEGPVPTTATQLLAAQVTDDGERSALDEARAYLVAALSDGPRPSLEIQREAKGCGIAEHTLRRARASLSVHPHKDGMTGPWVWTLPRPEVAHPTPEDPEDVHVPGMDIFGSDGHLRELSAYEPLAAAIMARGYPAGPGVVPDGGADAWWEFSKRATSEDWGRAAEALGWEPEP